MKRHSRLAFTIMFMIFTNWLPNLLTHMPWIYQLHQVTFPMMI